MPRAVLHLLCGLPGAGKTTLARRLEHELPALRLEPDEWMDRIVGDGYDEDRRAKVEAVQWDIACRAVNLGINAILENGFWSREERDGLRQKAAARGVPIKLHYLDVPVEELIRRIAQRNRELPPHTFPIEPEDVREWMTYFDPPTADELAEP